MEKMSDANVARAAKQASDISCFGAVVGMEHGGSTVSAVGAAADCTFSFLLGEQAVVSSIRNPETPFEMVVAFLLGVGFVPFLVVVAVFLGVLLVQLSYGGDAAWFAVPLQTVVGVFVFVELRSKLDLLALRAVLVRFGVLGHVFHPPGEGGRI